MKTNVSKEGGENSNKKIDKWVLKIIFKTK